MMVPVFLDWQPKDNYKQYVLVPLRVGGCGSGVKVMIVTAYAYWSPFFYVLSCPFLDNRPIVSEQ